MAKRLQYEWASKWHHKADANIIGRRIEAIAGRSCAEFPMAPPKAIVEDARDDRSPLHEFFTWDDGKAAEKCREQEARDLVQRITRVVISKDPDEEPRHVRAFVSVADSEGNRGYTTTLRAVADHDLRQQMLSDAMSGLRGWRQRYAELQELRPVLDAIDNLEEQVNAVHA